VRPGPLRPWELNLGLGERANQVALLARGHPKRESIIAGLELQLLRMRQGGVHLYSREAKKRRGGQALNSCPPRSLDDRCRDVSLS